jgi:hypothetical protein
LERAIQKHTNRMNQIARHGDIQQVAWHARNLLELMIYSKFCADRRENALRFFVDTLRDIIDMNRKYGEQMTEEYYKTIELAKKRLKVDEPAHKFTSLEEAAKRTGLKKLYEHDIKPLHKFVHASALSVSSSAIMGDSPLTRAEFARCGNEYSQRAMNYLSSSYMAELEEKYRSYLNSKLEK